MGRMEVRCLPSRSQPMPLPQEVRSSPLMRPALMWVRDNSRNTLTLKSFFTQMTHDLRSGARVAMGSAAPALRRALLVDGTRGAIRADGTSLETGTDRGECSIRRHVYAGRARRAFLSRHQHSPRLDEDKDSRRDDRKSRLLSSGTRGLSGRSGCAGFRPRVSCADALTLARDGKRTRW